MKKLVWVFLLIPVCAFADVRVSKQISTGKILEMQSLATPGTLIKNAVSNGIPADDVIEAMMTDHEYRVALDSQWADNVESARTKRMAEIRTKATALSAQYPSAFWNQGADYQSALSNTIATAASELDALSDIAAIKNYQPSWPSAPSH